MMQYVRRVATLLIIYTLLWAKGGSPVRAAGGTYHVDGSVGASGDGTSLATAFKTIQECADVAGAGDTCLIKGGIYRETVVVQNSGTADAPVTFASYNGEDVTISGAEVITGSWTLHEGSIYKANMPWSLNVRTSGNDQVTNNQIFVDGTMMVEARWPNVPPEKVTHLRVLDHAQADSISNLSTHAVTYHDAALSGFDAYAWQGGKINFGPGYNLWFATCDVTASTDSSISLQCNPDPGAWDNQTVLNETAMNTPSEGDYYYLWGKLHALDYPGEWFWDASVGLDEPNLYLWAPDGSDPSTKVVEARRRPWGLDLSGREYVVIEGVKLFAAGIRTDRDTHYVTIREIEGRYLWHFQENPPLSWTNGTKAIEFRGSNNTLQDSFLAYSAGPMVVFKGWGQETGNNRLINNVIVDAGYMSVGHAASGDSNGVERHQVISNTIFNSARTAVQLAVGVDVKYNDVYSTHLQMNDVGSISCWGTDGMGSDVAYNLVHDNQAVRNHDIGHWGGSGIFLDDNCRNFNVYRNVVWNVTAHALFTMGTNEPATRRFYNNTAFGSIAAHPKQGGGFNQTLEGTEFKNNVSKVDGLIHVLGYAPSSGLDDPNLILANNELEHPLWVNEDLLDFRLRHDSPAVDTGATLPGYTEGYTGSGPDKGALERGIRPFVAGAVLREKDLADLNVDCVLPADGDTASCTVTGLAFARKLPADFEIRIGDAAPVTGCYTRMDYVTHTGTGFCEGVPVGTQSGDVAIFVRIGGGSWVDTGDKLDAGGLIIYTLTPDHGPAQGGTSVVVDGRRFATRAPHYELPITLGNTSGSDLYEYQVQVTLDTADLIDQGKMRSDCGDLRFEDEYGALPYWIKAGCDTGGTHIWVNVPAIPTEGRTITMTYGNHALTGAGNVLDVFPLFYDDFSDGVISKWWSAGDNGSVTVREVDGQMQIAGVTDDGNKYHPIGFRLKTELLTFPSAYAIDADFSVITQQGSTSFKASVGGQNGTICLYTSGDDRRVGYYDSGWQDLGDSALDALTFSRKSVSTGYAAQGDSTVTVYHLENGDVKAQRSGLSDFGRGSFDYSPGAAGAFFDVRFDDVRIRNFAYPEPTVSLGAERHVGGVSLTVGGQPCTHLTVGDSESLTCATPPHDVGTVDVVVTNPNGDSYTLVGGYTYGEGFNVYLPLVVKEAAGTIVLPLFEDHGIERWWGR